MDNLLYIGLRGLAGSGKDTCANFLSFILDNYSYGKSEGWTIYNAMVNSRKVVRESLRQTYVIAFADQLKQICSTIFGIPIDAFYNGNKANAWVCLNKDFAYTETMPIDKCIMTATEFAENRDTDKAVWMSIREVMVYVGCYVLQQSLTKNIFVNVVDNSINRYNHIHKELKYVITTDVRFEHEVDYIHRKHGIMINITSNRVKEALNNIAEHSLDDNCEYDYIIGNDGTYEDLYNQVWDIVHENEEFLNITETPITRTLDSDTYLRLYSSDSDGFKMWKLCTNSKVNRICHDNMGDICLIDPSGGPIISLDYVIDGTELLVKKIELDEELDNTWWIYTK